MEPWANSVMDDISATISPMREELVFAFMISIYCKYAYYIIIRAARGELFLFFFARLGQCGSSEGTGECRE